MNAPNGLSREEQETFFRTSATSSEGWDCYTRDPRFKRLLESRGYEVRADSQGLWSCRIPRKALSVRRVSGRPKRELSPERREALRQQLAKGRLLSDSPVAERENPAVQVKNDQ